MFRSAIGLGGNVGDVTAAFRSALAALASRGITAAGVSHIYHTAPVGPSVDAPFRNACAVLESPLPPGELLAALQTIETELGRTRAPRWGPRTLDLDLLLHDGIILNEPELTVPHPGLAYRRFVLDPLAEIAPEWRHTVLNRTIGQLRQRLLVRPLPLALANGGDTDRVRERIEAQFGGAVAIIDDPAAVVESDPTIISLGQTEIAASAELRACVVVRPDPVLAAADAVEAAALLVAAMLDEPVRDGPLWH